MEAVPLRVREDSLSVEVDGRGKTRLRFEKIDAVAAAAVRLTDDGTVEEARIDQVRKKAALAEATAEPEEEAAATAEPAEEDDMMMGEAEAGAYVLDIARGGGAFVCGESSALMRSLEGKTGEPRAKYVHSTDKGLFDLPTVLNNVETWSNLGAIIAKAEAVGVDDAPDAQRLDLAFLDLGRLGCRGRSRGRGRAGGAGVAVDRRRLSGDSRRRSAPGSQRPADR